MRTLKKQKTKKSLDKIKEQFFVFDVETTKLEPMPKNFVFGVIYGWNFKKVLYSVDDFKKEFSKAKYNKSTFFAHNAEFDLLTIFGNIYQNLDNSAVFNGSFIFAKYAGITFGDSMNVLLGSVAKVGETLGMSKLENEKIHSEGLTKKNMNDKDIEYCIRDCEIVYTALLNIFEYVGTVKLTLASLSLYNFRNKFLQTDIMFSDLVDEFYNSYYGGRTEVFRLGDTNSKVYDINSLYPFAMENLILPDVKTLKKETKVDIKFLLYALKYFEGMAKVRILHHETYFGFIPKRHEINKSEKLIFPVGEFETTVNFNELRFALKHGVIEILKVYEVVYSSPVSSPFTEFVRVHYNNRMRTENELEKFRDKILLNSLYGRFAMRLKYETTYFDMIPFELIDELQKTEQFYLLKTFSENRDDCFLITENQKFKNSFFSIPTWSSYITSAARIKLLEGLLNNFNNGVTYCDTDSIFLTGEFSGDVGKNLGQWKLEEKTVIQINGLKNYVYTDSNGTHEAIKGVSKNSEKIGEGKYKVTKYFKTKEALRRNEEAGEQFEQTKELKHIYDKRIILKDGNTKPIKL